jgi:hypothetical protein
MSTPLRQVEQHTDRSGNFPERSIKDIVSDLSKPIADRHIKQRKQGGQSISYIEWHVAAQYLDHYAPGWSWRILSIQQVGNLVVVHGELAIPSADGVVVRHATGIEESDAKSYGDAVSNASAMCFKRACAMFGLARHLYAKD